VHDNAVRHIQWQRERAYPLVRKLRDARPTIPIVLMADALEPILRALI